MKEVNDTDLHGLSREELLELVRQQRAALETYKETLGRIYQEFDAKIEELSLIRRVSDVLRLAEDVRAMATGLTEVVMDELPADFCAFMLADEELTRLSPLVVFDREWEGPRQVEAPGPEQELVLGEGELGAAIAEGRMVILSSVEGPGPSPWPGGLPEAPGSVLALPLVARQQLVGAIILVSVAQGVLGEEHTRTLAIICDHAASALVNARLIEQLGEINERLLASELEAHQAREYLEHILEVAGDFILIVDEHRRVTYANRAVERLGVGREELVGREVAELFSHPSRATQVLAGGAKAAEELELVGQGGQRVVVLANVTPLPESRQELIILRDITRRRALERQLMHAEKLASVGILAAGVAHEIGNPLSAISGYAQLLAGDESLSAEQQEFARAIAEQAERIERIIRELLDYSRPSQYLGQPVDVNQAIEAVVAMFFTSKRLARENLEIDLSFAPALPKVRMDRDQLQQVVLNIAMNAAQAMAGGGRLTITTAEQDGWVVISFADTGPGIPEDLLPRIFDPFFTTKPPGQGTGLGLSICDRIVSAAGGRIEVDSAPGKGSTFRVWLPAAGEEGRQE